MSFPDVIITLFEPLTVELTANTSLVLDSLVLLLTLGISIPAVVTPFLKLSNSLPLLLVFMFSVAVMFTSLPAFNVTSPFEANTSPPFMFKLSLSEFINIKGVVTSDKCIPH